jgi:hypothetical protein
MYSTVPDAITSLVTLLRAAPALSGVNVVDGNPGGSLPDLEVLTVGWNGDPDDTTATTGSQRRESMSVQRDREFYEIQCSVAVLNGSADMTSARIRAYELLAAVGALLASDKTLGGAVMTAGLGDVALGQQQNQRGAVARVLFTVACDAYTKIS